MIQFDTQRYLHILKETPSTYWDVVATSWMMQPGEETNFFEGTRDCWGWKVESLFGHGMKWLLALPLVVVVESIISALLITTKTAVWALVVGAIAILAPLFLTKIGATSQP